MQISALPSPLQQLDSRPFSFRPPIANVKHNEWMIRRATWSEIVAVNRLSGEEVWIPRTLVAEVSAFEAPVAVVWLRRELQWKQGVIETRRTPVVEFPMTQSRGGAAISRQPGRLAPVVSIRLEHTRENRTGLKVAVAVMLGSIGYLLAADIIHHMEGREPAPQRPLAINSQHR